jgi:hypothetical protein
MEYCFGALSGIKNKTEYFSRVFGSTSDYCAEYFGVSDGGVAEYCPEYFRVFFSIIRSTSISEYL